MRHNYVDDDFDDSYESLVALSERIGDAKPKGLPSHIIQSLPTRKFKPSTSSSSSSSDTIGAESKNEDDKCAICLCEFENCDDLTGLPCMHWFHTDCNRSWLKESRLCPM